MLTDIEKKLTIDVIRESIRCINAVYYLNRYTDEERKDMIATRDTLDSAVNKIEDMSTIESEAREKKRVRVNLFIAESDMFGFHIIRLANSNRTNIYKCTTKCNRCGNLFTKDVSIEIDEDFDIKTDLHIYCDPCKDTLKNRTGIVFNKHE
jgi:hypothetical protein